MRIFHDEQKEIIFENDKQFDVHKNMLPARTSSRRRSKTVILVSFAKMQKFTRN